MSSIAIVGRDSYYSTFSEEVKKQVIDSLVSALYKEGIESTISSQRITFELPKENHEMHLSFMFRFMTEAAEQVLEHIPDSFTTFPETGPYLLRSIEYLHSSMLTLCANTAKGVTAPDNNYKVYLVFERNSDIELVARLGLAQDTDHVSLEKHSLAVTRLVLAQGQKR